MDRETNRSRGFGFVEMPDDNSARQASKAPTVRASTAATWWSTRPVPARRVTGAAIAEGSAAATTVVATARSAAATAGTSTKRTSF